MLTAEQIIDSLTSATTDENIIQAIEWIKSKRPSDKSAKLIVAKLMEIPQAGPHLDSLTKWVKAAKKWNCFDSTHRLASLEHLDWLLLLLNETPNQPKAGVIWNNLLSYRNKEIVDGASMWLLNHAQDELTATFVATQLLDETPTPAIVKRSKKLLEKEPRSFLLARALLYREPDSRTVSIGIQLLNDDEPLIGAMVAGALAQSGKRGTNAVAKFLNEHKKSKKFRRILEEIFHEAPELAMPLVHDWVTKHPKSSETQNLLLTLYDVNPSPEIAELLWTWTKTNSPESDILNTTTVLSNEFPPVDAIAYARNWLDANIHRVPWTAVYISVIRRSSLEEQVELLNRWSDRISEDRLIHFTAQIIIAARDNTIDESTLWMQLSTVRTSLPDFDQFKRKVTDEVEKIANSQIESQYPIASKVTATDPNSIQIARNWLSTRRLEWRWSSLHEYRGQIIAALLTVSPDDFVMDEAKRWLERKREFHFDSIYQKVSDLYNLRRSIDSDLKR